MSKLMFIITDITALLSGKVQPHLLLDMQLPFESNT